MVLPIIIIGVVALVMLALLVAFIFVNPWAVVAMFAVTVGGLAYYFKGNGKKHR